MTHEDIPVYPAHRRTDVIAPPPPIDPLPDFTDLDLETVSHESTHPMLAAVAGDLLPRMVSGEVAMAFYEDGPYQL